MLDVLAGIRVVEVATWTFVPISGAVLAEWGADVIKIEHPETGDPQRGLISSGLVPAGAGGVNYMLPELHELFRRLRSNKVRYNPHEHLCGVMRDKYSLGCCKLVAFAVKRGSTSQQVFRVAQSLDDIR